MKVSGWLAIATVAIAVMSAPALIRLVGALVPLVLVVGVVVTLLRIVWAVTRHW